MSISDAERRRDRAGVRVDAVRAARPAARARLRLAGRDAARRRGDARPGHVRAGQHGRGVVAAGRPARRRRERALLRPARPRRRRAPVRRPARHRRRRGRLRVAAAGLAGAGGPAVLRRDRGPAGGRAPAPAHPDPAAPGDRGRRRGARPDRPAGRPGHRAGRRGGAAGRARRRPDRPDGRHRGDDPGRAGPRDPGRRTAACWSCRAVPAPARPRSRCTGRRTCSTPTGEQLERRGVLVVGPNPTFLRYIGEVLPALGETGVVLATGRRAVPRASPATGRSRRRSPRSRAGRRWPRCWRAAVADRQRVPDGALVLLVDGGAGAAHRPPPTGAPATAARRTRRPHNQARPVFVEQFVDRGRRPSTRPTSASDSGAGGSLAGVAGELDLELLTARARRPRVGAATRSTSCGRA